MALIEVVGGVIEAGADGSESAIAGVNDFSLDESFDYGEVRNNEHPTFASLIEDQTSWTATLNIDLYADDSTDTLDSSVNTLFDRARNREIINVVITYGGAGDRNNDEEQNFGDLNFAAKTEEARGKITSVSREGTFIADGEVWNTEIEVQGIEPWSKVT